MKQDNRTVIFHLKFKSSELLDDILEYVKRIKEAHPDAVIHVGWGGER